ncbi:MAG TPA: ATP-binding cassette domain-containing protein [Stellaceae bacterium]|nr:ATP-binding cassette domain-containing protein [Stellaceae bacterium]
MLKLDRIGKRYAGLQALSDISLALEPGGFYFLTGASGAGKTTLLDIISLAELPSSGRMSLFETDIASLGRPARTALRRRIGVVFQDLRLIDDANVRDNIALPLRLTAATERQVRDNVAELMDWFGLTMRGNAPVGTLSISERQRVAIARAIVTQPELLIADEPSGYVDHEVARLLVRVFKRINELGTTVLIATHDIAFANLFEHQRYHLEQGMLADADIVPPQ